MRELGREPVVRHNVRGCFFIFWFSYGLTIYFSASALCVNSDLDYVRSRDLKSGAVWVFAEARLGALYPASEKKGYKGGEFEVLARLKGSELVGACSYPSEAACPPLVCPRILSSHWIVSSGGQPRPPARYSSGTVGPLDLPSRFGGGKT